MISVDSKKKWLVKRLEHNYLMFQYSLRGLSRTQLFEKAGRISAVTEVYEYMTKGYEWDDEDEIDFFLLFRDPLVIVADLYHDERLDAASDLSAFVWDALNNSDELILVEYPREKTDDALYNGFI